MFWFDLLRGVEKQSVVIVVSPLVALMKEQAASITSKGISAACISDKVVSPEEKRVW